MRIWLKTSVNSFLFPWIAGSARVAFSAEYRGLMWDAATASEACLVGIQRERHNLLGSKVMWEGGEKKGVFEAWVNEVLSPVWGEEERMSVRLPVRQTDIPADGSFDSQDKCFITAGSTCTTCTYRGANLWIQSSHSSCSREQKQTWNVALRTKQESCDGIVVFSEASYRSG